MLKKACTLRLLGCVTLLALLACSCAPERKASPRGTIRVALLQGADAVTLSSRGTLAAKDLGSGKRIAAAKNGKPLVIRFAPRGLTVSGDAYDVRGLHVTSASDKLTLNGKTYPGSLRVLRRPDGLLAVNIVDLGAYLKAVVPSEMSPAWPEHALKAQAVVSRSFVLHHALRNREKDFDISASTQVYNPSKRDPRTDKAVDGTRRTVLFYRGELLLPFFCASCGGFTEYATNVWESKERFPPPVECPFCRETSNFRWQHRLRFDEFRRKLGAAGIPGARSIAVQRRSASGGRITALKIKTDKGDTIVKINRFRMIMGPNLIRSGFFEIEFQDGYLIFKGRGWGHGVGMCQRGAKVLAERGKSFKSILRHYFPGARTRKMRW